VETALTSSRITRTAAALAASAAILLGAAACGDDDADATTAAATAPVATAPIATAPPATAAPPVATAPVVTATTPAAPATTPAAPGPTPTADEFRRSADAICVRYDAQLEALPAPTSSAEIPAYFRRAVAIYRAQYGELQGLVPPPELKPDYDAALGILGRIVARAEQAERRIAAGEDAATVVQEATPELDALNAQADARAQALGLTRCGSDDDADGTTTS